VLGLCCVMRVEQRLLIKSLKDVPWDSLKICVRMCENMNRVWLD